MLENMVPHNFIEITHKLTDLFGIKPGRVKKIIRSSLYGSWGNSFTDFTHFLLEAIVYPRLAYI